MVTGEGDFLFCNGFGTGERDRDLEGDRLSSLLRLTGGGDRESDLDRDRLFRLGRDLPPLLEAEE